MFLRSAAFIGLALGVPLVFAGCGSEPALSSSNGDTPTIIKPFVPDASDADTAFHDEAPQATPGSAQTLQGSPLCHGLGALSADFLFTCIPDDAINACDLPLDAGSAEAGAYDGPTPACRVVASGAGPGCVPAGLGMTNASCKQSSDCAAGHECIGAGSCRHYCCAGNSACQINEFCDVQETAQEPKLLVPVCMPELPCTLLDSDWCPASQQCSVVKEDGATSCVNVGTAQVDEPCDDKHCARGLVCIGGQGSRVCGQLCYTADRRACEGTGRKCRGGLPLFPNPLIGVCQ